MSFCVMIIATASLMGQCPGTDTYDMENLPLTQQARVPATRAEAIEGLLAIAEDVDFVVDDRRLAVIALTEVAPPEAAERLRVLAAEVEQEKDIRRGCFHEGHLADAATIAYWRIKVVNEESVDAQKALLLELFRSEEPSYRSQMLSRWAISALAEYGDRNLLPVIVERFKDKEGGRRRGQDMQWLAQRIAELTSSGKKRFEILKSALECEDPTEAYLLKRWAISGLARLQTEESDDVLLAYARRLQEENCDENGTQLRIENSHLEGEIWSSYHIIVKTLCEYGWTMEQLNASGVFPRKYFAGIG